jgi:hypothetical protein
MIYTCYISLLFSDQSPPFKGGFGGIKTRFSRKDLKGFRVKLTLTVNSQYSTVNSLDMNEDLPCF